MADFGNVRKRSRIGAPPKPDQTLDNLSAPEVAPAASGLVDLHTLGPVDLRILRATGRTEQFGTRVTKAFKKEFYARAKKDGLRLNELLEKCFEAYKQTSG